MGEPIPAGLPASGDLGRMERAEQARGFADLHQHPGASVCMGSSHQSDRNAPGDSCKPSRTVAGYKSQVYVGPLHVLGTSEGRHPASHPVLEMGVGVAPPPTGQLVTLPKAKARAHKPGRSQSQLAQDEGEPLTGHTC